MRASLIDALQILTPALAAGAAVPLGPLPAAGLGLVAATLLVRSGRAVLLGAVADPDRELPADLRERLDLRDAQVGRREQAATEARQQRLSDLWGCVGSRDLLAELSRAAGPYVRESTGAGEFAVLRLHPREGELQGAWVGPAGARAVRWAIAGLGGGAAAALRSGRVIGPGGSGPGLVLSAGEERPSVIAPHTTYLAVPLIGPRARPECAHPGWLESDACTEFEPHPAAGARGLRPTARDEFSLGRCGGCRRFPAQGLLLLTDAGRDRPLGELDLERATSLGRPLAAILEYDSLRREVHSGERFREDLLDAMLDGLVSTDQFGRVVFANRRARELYGEDVDLVGMHLEQVLRMPEGSNALARTLAEGVAYLQADALLVRSARAASIPVRVNLAPFRAEDGAMRGAVCVMEDRSRVRALENEIRHLDALAAIGRFASSLAHEIRNPLAGIQAGIGWLGRAEGLGGEQRENLEVIDREVRRMDTILRDLMAVAKPRETVLAPIELGEIVDRAVSSIAPLALERSISVEARLDARGAIVHADRDQIHQVLVNLLKNAVEVTADGGRVELVGQVADGEPDRARIEVLDRGPGIDAADLPHLFEPFFSRKSGGTGLGLFVSHGIVERHAGRLHASNRPRGGARFVLELECVPALLGGMR